MSDQESGSQVWLPEHLRLAIDAARVALWSWNVDTDHFTMDERAFTLWGIAWAGEISFDELSTRVHPFDRDRVRTGFQATRSAAGDYEIDFRIVVDDEVRWVSARGQGADAGIVNRIMFGIFLDVTGRKQAEEAHELLSGEMSHRVKNLLAIAAALTRMTSRTATTIKGMASTLTERLMSLHRAHDLVRPLPGTEGKSALLGDLLSVLLAPYDDQGTVAGLIRVSVPRIAVGEKAATTLALVIHELATNSVKHGGLSASDGTLNISSTSDDEEVCLKWAETGGPNVRAVPQMSGFGSKLISRSMSQHFGTALSYDWRPTGLVATLRMRKDLLAH